MQAGLQIVITLIAALPKTGAELPPHAIARLGEDRLRHGGAVAAAQWCPDTQMFVSGGAAGVVRWWDSKTGSAVASWRDFKVPPNQRGILRIDCGSAGRVVAVTAYGALVRLDGPGTQHRLGGGSQRFIDARFASGGTVLAVTDAGQINRWAPDAPVQVLGAVAKRMRPLGGRVAPGGSAAVLHTDHGLLWWRDDAKPAFSTIADAAAIETLEWSASGDRVFAIMRDGSARVFDSQTHALAPATLPKVAGSITTVDANGATAVIGSSEGLWALGAKTPRIASGGVTVAKLSPDGKRVLAGGLDQQLKIIDLKTGGTIARRVGHRRPLSSVDVSPDGTLVVTGAGDGVLVWQASSGDLLGSSAIERVRVVRWLDDRQIVALDDDGTVSLVAAGTGATMSSARIKGATAMDVTPTGQIVVASPKGLHVANSALEFEAKVVQWWSFTIAGLVADPSGQSVAALVRSTAGVTSAEVRSLADGALRFGVEPRRTKQGPDSVVAVAYTADGAKLLAAHGDGSLSLRNARNGEGLSRLGRQRGGVAAMAYAPKGPWLAVATPGGVVQLWDFRRSPARGPRTLEGHDGPINTLAWGPAGQWLITGSDDLDGLIWSAALPKRTP